MNFSPFPHLKLVIGDEISLVGIFVGICTFVLVAWQIRLAKLELEIIKRQDAELWKKPVLWLYSPQMTDTPELGPESWDLNFRLSNSGDKTANKYRVIIGVPERWIFRGSIEATPWRFIPFFPGRKPEVMGHRWYKIDLDDAVYPQDYISFGVLPLLVETSTFGGKKFYWRISTEFGQIPEGKGNYYELTRTQGARLDARPVQILTSVEEAGLSDKSAPSG